MQNIPLTNSNWTAQVSDEDYDKVKEYTWRLTMNNGGYYAITGQGRDGSLTQMANLIMGKPPQGHIWDHKDDNGLNNQRDNLQLCTYSQNFQRRGKYINNTSGYKGVRWHTQNKKWQVRITANKKTLVVGYFDDIIEAALAYDEAAQKYFGKFANTNF